MAKKKREINITDFTKGARFAKAILLVFIILSVIFGLGVLIFKASIDVDKIKTNANAQFEKIIEEKSEGLAEKPVIKINGDVKFYVLPKPHIVFNDIEVSNVLNGEYVVNAKIDKVSVNLATADILKKKVTPEKIFITDSNFNFKEYEINREVYLFEDIFKSFGKDYENKGIIIVGRTDNILIDGLNYRREFDLVDVTFFYAKNRFSAKGHLSSNKQPLDIDLDIDLSGKKNFSGKLGFSSIAFSYNTNFNGTKSEDGFDFDGKTNLSINNFQVFARTMFNSNSFYHRKIIDNRHFRTKFDFSFKNKVFTANDINFSGENIDGTATAEFDFNENKTNKLIINLKKLDLDRLMNNDMSSDKALNERYITIFRDNYKTTDGELEEASYMDKYFKFNHTDLSVVAENITINKGKIDKINLNLSYGGEKGIEMKSVTAKLPFETNFSINENNKINISGSDFKKFANFLRGIDNANITTGNQSFSLDGDFSVVKNKIIIDNASFNTADIASKNIIEIDFESGVNFIAIKSNVENLNLNNYFNIGGQTSSKPLRIQMLFLNNIHINLALIVHADKVQYGNLEDENYRITAFASRGLLHVSNLNMNDKFGGSLTIDIGKQKPLLNVNLGGVNTKITDKLDLEEILFNLPLLDQFYGNFNLIFENTDFKKSKIKNLKLASTIDSGTIKIDDFSIDGFGGHCKVNGFAEVKLSKKINFTFSNCNFTLEEILYLFTKGNKDKVLGNVGIGAVILSSGVSRNDFRNNYSLRANVKGSNLIVKNFGLTKLNVEMFRAHLDHQILRDIKPNDIINSKAEYTIFDTFEGSVGYVNSKGIFDIDMSRQFINGKLKGNFSFDADPNGLAVDAYWTFNMLTGTATSTTPVVIVYKLDGSTNRNFKMSGNLDAVNNYLTGIRGIYKDALGN